MSERIRFLSPEKQKANDAAFDRRMATLKDLERGIKLHKAGKISDEELHNLKLKAGTISADSKFIKNEIKGEEWPEEVPSRHGDIIFKLIKVMPDRAKYALIDAETGKEWEPGGRVFGSIKSLMASAEDTIMPQGGRQSSQF